MAQRIENRPQKANGKQTENSKPKNGYNSHGA